MDKGKSMNHVPVSIVELGAPDGDVDAEATKYLIGMFNVADVLQANLFNRKSAARSVFGLMSRNAERQLKLVHEEMRGQSAKTKDIDGKPFYVEVFDRKDQGVSLRWRTVGAKHEHVLWSDVLVRLDGVPPQMVRWYSDVNRRIQILNLCEQNTRASLRYAKRLCEVLASN
jgi:hypothetical protein